MNELSMKLDKESLKRDQLNSIKQSNNDNLQKMT